MKAQRLAIVLLLVGVALAGCGQSRGNTWRYGQPISAKNIFDREDTTGCADDEGAVTVVGLANPWRNEVTFTQVEDVVAEPLVVKADEEETKSSEATTEYRNDYFEVKSFDAEDAKTVEYTAEAEVSNIDEEPRAERLITKELKLEDEAVAIPQPTATIERVATSEKEWKGADNFGCAEWRDGACVKCSYRFIARSRTCEPVNPLCSTWDNTGKCLTCYKGYTVCAEGCVPAAAAPGPKYEGLLCAKYDSNARCVRCSSNAFFKNGECAPVNPNCKTFDSSNGWCNTCYAGYSLQSGLCNLVPLIPDTSAPADLLCAAWKGRSCLRCSVNAYFKNGVCTQVNPLCKTFDSNGACTSCYKGYVNAGADCALAQVSVDNSAPSDLLCAQWERKVCVKCASTAFFRNGVCVQSDPLCRTFNGRSGACTACYKGYYLDNGQCVKEVNVPDTTAPSDLLCALWNGKICLKCSSAAFFRNGVCTASDPLCKTFDSNNGNCLTCYKGYGLINGNCVRLPEQPDNSAPSDLLCARWNKNVCVACSDKAFSRNGRCVAADPLCKTFNAVNGGCTSCYKGYSRHGGECWRDALIPDNAPPSDLLCARWNGNVCQECSRTSYFNGRVCVQSDPLCKTFDSSNGACRSCYSGYAITGRQCVRVPDAPAPEPTDLLCAKWAGLVCKACSSKAYFKDGVCVQSDPLCKTFERSNGACTSCYKGYALDSGRCVKTVETVKDVLCAKWNDGICIQCSRTAYFKNGACVQSDPLCRSFDKETGACNACYKGYNIKNGNCVVAPIVQPVGPKQLPANYDIFCKTYYDGICKACFFGYKLKGGVCIEDFDSTPCKQEKCD